MAFEDRTLREFSELLASPAPVPGGGGASAAVAAIAAALGDMVGELTVGKKKYADVEVELRARMAVAQDLRRRFLACIDRDAQAFEPLSRAYSMPKDAPDYEQTMEKCLRDAADAPTEVFDLCCEAIELLKGFGEKGSRLVLSDAATGAAFCKAALTGAAINIKVNTKLMKDRAYADALDAHVDAQLAVYAPMADAVVEAIYGRAW